MDHANQEELTCSISCFFGCYSTVNCEKGRQQGRKISCNRWYKDDEQVASYIIHHYHECMSAPAPPPTMQDSFSIPKQIHFIWFGPRPIPRHVDAQVFPQNKAKTQGQDGKYWNECSRSWKMHHSTEDGWSHKLWNEASMEQLHAKHEPSCECMATLRRGYSYALNIKNYGMASDIARLEILYIYGGLYVDFDYYCFRSISDLHQSYDFYCGASNSGSIEVNNGLIGCKKDHFLIVDLIKSISRWFSNFQHFSCIDNQGLQLSRDLQKESTLPSSLMSSFLDDQSLLSFRQVQKNVTSMQVIENTGPGLLTKSIFKFFHQHVSAKRDDEERSFGRIIVLPASAFHPLPNNQRHHVNDHISDDELFAEIINNVIDSDLTRAVHLWSCSWQS